MISLPPVLVSSSEIVIEPRQQGKSSLTHFSKGQIVSAKVLRALSGRSALLLIDGQKVTAKTFLPLQTGQTILLKLEQTGNRQVFKFAGQPGEAAGPGQTLALGSFGKAGPYVMLARVLDGLGAPDTGETPGPSKPLATLGNLVASLSLKSETLPPDFLNRLMGGSGLLWESKLAALVAKGATPTPAAMEDLVGGDLKATCLRLLSSQALPEALAGQLREVLEGLEKHQLLNQHLLENDGRYLLPIPLSDQQILKFGQLLLGLGGRKEKGAPEDRLVTVSFLLSLSQLGEFRADFSILKTGLTGAFGVADEESRALVTAHLPELKRKLRDHGYSVLDISCRVLEPRHLSEMSLVAEAVVPESDGFFNLVV